MASAVIAAVAAYLFWQPSEVKSGVWLLFLCAAAMILAGMIAQVQQQGDKDELGEAQDTIEFLEQQIERQNSVVDQLGDGLDVALFVCDPKVNVLYTNKPGLELFGFANPVGRPLLAVTLSSELESLVSTAVRTGKAQNAELRFAGPAERVGRVRAWVQEGTGRVFVSIHDVTELRRLERIRRDFVSNVSHELRTPLTVIRSMSETLVDNPETPEEKRNLYLSKVVSEVDRLTMMANDLLVLTSAESQPTSKSPSDLAEVFRSVVEQLQPQAADKGLQLLYTGPNCAIVPANEQQMRQVALNLVQNAINYSVKGTIGVSTSQTAAEFVARVTDTGQGISSEDLPKIFERFYRIDRGRSRQIGGTGLGLSIVKHIVESHGGTVSVESALNVGSTFTIRLPMEVSPQS